MGWVSGERMLDLPQRVQVQGMEAVSSGKEWGLVQPWGATAGLRSGRGAAWL